MALVNLAPTVTLSLEDETGSSSSMQLSIPAATTVADARTAANALVPLVQAITDCTVTGYSIAFSTLETAPAAPGAGSRVERKGVFVFRADNAKTARVTVPGIKPTVVLGSGRIDDDQADVSAFRLAVIGGIWSDSNGSSLSSTEEIYESYRRTSRRQAPTDRRIDADADAGA